MFYFYHPFGCTSLEDKEIRERLFSSLEVFWVCLRFKLKAENKPKSWIPEKGSDVFYWLIIICAIVCACRSPSSQQPVPTDGSDHSNLP